MPLVALVEVVRPQVLVVVSLTEQVVIEFLLWGGGDMARLV